MYKFQPALELLRKIDKIALKNAFVEASDSDEGITLESFQIFLLSKLCLNITQYDVKYLFYQMDRYSRGIINQTDLSEYLVEYEERRLISDESPFNPSPTLYPGVRCQDSVIKWALYPEIPDIVDEVAGHYASVSKSGIINIWSRDLEKRLEASIETVDDGSGKRSTWATSLVCLPREKMMAVSTTAGDIRFFRSSIFKFEHKFSIVYLPYLVLEMHSPDSRCLVCGDFSGDVYIIRMEETFFKRHQKRASHFAAERILFDDVKKGRISGVSAEGTPKMHSSPIKKVEYIPTLFAVICCSMDTENAMVVHFLKNKKSLRFPSVGGIICFVFSERLNCVVTGGADQSIKIWNPNVNTACNESLVGHTSPVNHLMVMESRQFLISSDLENVIRVWDLLRPKCLQIIKFKDWEFPEKPSFSSIFLDPSIDRLILTTYRIGKLEMNRKKFRDKTHPCSEYIILAAYSNVYNCVVTVGDASTVAVWDAGSGALIYEYGNSHEIVDSQGTPKNVSITAAGLDPSQRRLITADRMGTTKVWNFHFGLCLRVFETNCVVMSLSFVGFHIFAAGSSGVVVQFYDNGTDIVEPMSWEKHHQKAIVSLDRYKRTLIASASCDGELLVWLQRSSDAKIRLKDLEGEATMDEDYLAKSEMDRRRLCSISQVLFLQKREMDFFVGNLVSCGMDGRIRFWNIVCTPKVNQGRLLSKFRSVFRYCDGVLCLATDKENRYLISGDTLGYIRVYEIDDYYSAYGSVPPRTKATSQQKVQFPFLKLHPKVDQRHSMSSKFSNGKEMGFVPFLLNCFRAHLGPVVKINYTNEKDMLVTAGKECSVRLWTLSGSYVGRLGPLHEPWCFNCADERLNNKPPDVTSVASTITLYVMNNGNVPHWTRAFKALRKCRLGHQPEGFTPRSFERKRKESKALEELSAKSSLEDDLDERLLTFRGITAYNQNLFKKYEQK